MICVAMPNNEYLSYDDRIAIFFSSFKLSVVGVCREEDRPLTEDELVEAIDQIGPVEERDLTDEEFEVLNGIVLYHPEIRHSAVAKKGNFLNTILDGLDNLFKSKDEIKEKKKLQDYLEKNWGKMKSIEKEMKKNEEVVDFMELAMKEGELGAGDLAAFNEILKSNSDWMDALDIPEDPDNMENFIKTHKPVFVFTLGEMKDMGIDVEFNMSGKKLSKMIEKDIKDYLDVSPDEVAVDDNMDAGKERVVIVRFEKLAKALKFIKNSGLDPDDLKEKIYQK